MTVNKTRTSPEEIWSIFHNKGTCELKYYLSCVSEFRYSRRDKQGEARQRQSTVRRDRRCNCNTSYVPTVTNISFLARHFLVGDILFCARNMTLRTLKLYFYVTYRFEFKKLPCFIKSLLFGVFLLSCLDTKKHGL